MNPFKPLPPISIRQYVEMLCTDTDINVDECTAFVEQRHPEFFPYHEWVYGLELLTVINHFIPLDEVETRSSVYRAALKTEFFKVTLNEYKRSLFSKNKPSDIILIASTPRSGNTIVNQILKTCLDVPSVAINSITQLHPKLLPSACIVQLHSVLESKEEKEFINFHRTEKITVARHPFDVLVSMLHYAQYEPKVDLWLDGYGFRRTRELQGQSPISAGYTNWIKSEQARNLMDVSTALSMQPDVNVIKYEDLLQKPVETIEELLRDMLINVTVDVPKTVNSVLKSGLKNKKNNHRWKGKSNNWRSYVTPDMAKLLGGVFKKDLDILDYDVDMLDLPSTEEVQARWQSEV